MAVASSFDQWQKDVFFSAAEEVQESADVMESLFRMWMRDLKDSEAPDELHGELHTALGTAKWQLHLQLEEFEKAVRLRHRRYPSEKNAITRHKQFVAAIAEQIARVEKALREEGKQPLRWVQLDAEEQDDLAFFLSEMPQNMQETRDDVKGSDRDNCSSQAIIRPESVRGLKDKTIGSSDGRHVVEVATKEPLGRKDNEGCADAEQLHGLRRASSLLDVGAWKIVIADDVGAESKAVEIRSEMPNHASNLCGLLKTVESTSKLRWFRNSFWKAKSEDLQLRHRLQFRAVSRLAQCHSFSIPHESSYFTLLAKI
ncbi:syntaxin 6, N-terminal domain containing protein [Musa troglodytarum]|uniref:Syntaxin 6, N-terminal domain containing protein n=1 Tax=Musa troglodytarum TaxID=320322 RepID=A0A9E7FCY1_9LILI|nr:syntaxin 6, N-terminal domain containing protein [Musa troglodytarum]